MKIYIVKVLHFSLNGVTPSTCPNKKSFWIWVIYTPEGYVGGQPYFFVEKVFLRNTLLNTLSLDYFKIPLISALFVHLSCRQALGEVNQEAVGLDMNAVL